jgi:hypothetical protein
MYASIGILYPDPLRGLRKFTIVLCHFEALYIGVLDGDYQQEHLRGLME